MEYELIPVSLMGVIFTLIGALIIKNWKRIADAWLVASNTFFKHLEFNIYEKKKSEFYLSRILSLLLGILFFLLGLFSMGYVIYSLFVYDLG